MREQQGDPPGEVGRPEEESEARAVPAACEVFRNRGTNKRPQPNVEMTMARTNLKRSRRASQGAGVRIPG